MIGQGYTPREAAKIAALHGYLAAGKPTSQPRRAYAEIMGLVNLLFPEEQAVDASRDAGDARQDVPPDSAGASQEREAFPGESFYRAGARAAQGLRQPPQAGTADLPVSPGERDPLTEPPQEEPARMYWYYGKVEAIVNKLDGAKAKELDAVAGKCRAFVDDWPNPWRVVALDMIKLCHTRHKSRVQQIQSGVIAKKPRDHYEALVTQMESEIHDVVVSGDKQADWEGLADRWKEIWATWPKHAVRLGMEAWTFAQERAYAANPTGDLFGKPSPSHRDEG